MPVWKFSKFAEINAGRHFQENYMARISSRCQFIEPDLLWTLRSIDV